MKYCYIIVLMVCSSPLWSQGNSPALVSGQKVQLKKMARDMEQIRKSIVTTGPSEFQNPDIVQARQKRFKQFTEALNRYPQVNEPEVQAARNEYFALQKALKAEFKRANDQRQQLGDVQARMRKLQQNFDQYPVPKPMTPPFSAQEVKDWVKQASEARTVGEHNLKELNAMAPLAYLPNNPGVPQSGAPFDANDLKRMQRNAVHWQESVQKNYHSTADTTSNLLQQKLNEINARWQEDPTGDKKWVFLKEDQVEQAAALFAETKALAQSSLYLAQALQQDQSVATQALAAINQAEKTYQSKAERALNASRLPEPATEDDDLTELAEEILERPRYQFGSYGPIVLTTDKIIDRESKSSEIDIDDVDIASNGDVKLSGTETTWTYRWQEFKFATPLKDPDGRWYIWWITAKKYSSGSSITPIGEWVAGTSTKGNPILPDNF